MTEFNPVEAHQKHFSQMKSKINQSVENLKNLFAYLSSLNSELSLIEIEYEGSGDQGQVEFFNFYKDSDNVDEFETIEINIDIPLPDHICNGQKESTFSAVQTNQNICARSMLDDLAWDLAYSQNPGFEINDGAYGRISISRDKTDPDQISVTLSHSERVMDTRDHEYHF